LRTSVFNTVMGDYGVAVIGLDPQLLRNHKNLKLKSLWPNKATGSNLGSGKPAFYFYFLFFYQLPFAVRTGPSIWGGVVTAAWPSCLTTPPNPTRIHWGILPTYPARPTNRTTIRVVQFRVSFSFPFLSSFRFLLMVRNNLA